MVHMHQRLNRECVFVVLHFVGICQLRKNLKRVTSNGFGQPRSGYDNNDFRSVETI